MPQVLRVAWRNIWRNGRRTAITIVSISLSTALLIVSFALFEGMLHDMVENATRLMTGDAQVHAQGYRQERSIYNSIVNPEKILSAAQESGLQATARAYGYGLVSSGTKSAGAMFWGVDPEKERSTFGLANEIFAGNYLSNQPARQVVLGRKLAKSLHVEVGSEIVAVVEAADGSLGNEAFQVAGIFKTVGEDIDRGAAVIHRQDFDDLFMTRGVVHEIAFNAWGKLTAEEVVEKVVEKAKDSEVKTWSELLPQLSNLVYMFDAGMWIFALIFYLAAGLGVMNTMLMATYERMREFGILKAIGATSWRIIRDISVESLMMAVVSTFLGLGVGLIASIYLQAEGIDMSNFGSGNFTVTGIAFNPIWRARLDASKVILPMMMMWFVCVVASLYPAWKAARLDPVKAIMETGGF